MIKVMLHMQIKTHRDDEPRIFAKFRTTFPALPVVEDTQIWLPHPKSWVNQIFASAYLVSMKCGEECVDVFVRDREESNPNFYSFDFGGGDELVDSLQGLRDAGWFWDE